MRGSGDACSYEGRAPGTGSLASAANVVMTIGRRGCAGESPRARLASTVLHWHLPLRARLFRSGVCLLCVRQGGRECAPTEGAALPCRQARAVSNLARHFSGAVNGGGTVTSRATVKRGKTKAVVMPDSAPARINRKFMNRDRRATGIFRIDGASHQNHTDCETWTSDGPCVAAARRAGRLPLRDEVEPRAPRELDGGRRRELDARRQRHPTTHRVRGILRVRDVRGERRDCPPHLRGLDRWLAGGVRHRRRKGRLSDGLRHGGAPSRDRAGAPGPAVQRSSSGTGPRFRRPARARR